MNWVSGGRRKPALEAKSETIQPETILSEPRFTGEREVEIRK
jgi:hypothetical protein